MGGLVLRRLDVDGPVGEEPVLAAVVEVQMRIRHRGHATDIEAVCGEGLGEGPVDRPVPLVDLGLPRAYPGIEEQHSRFVDHGESQDGADLAFLKVSRRKENVGDVQGYDLANHFNPPSL